jgi:hypothetical protein
MCKTLRCCSHVYYASVQRVQYIRPRPFHRRTSAEDFATQAASLLIPERALITTSSAVYRRHGDILSKDGEAERPVILERVRSSTSRWLRKGVPVTRLMIGTDPFCKPWEWKPEKPRKVSGSRPRVSDKNHQSHFTRTNGTSGFLRLLFVC